MTYSGFRAWTGDFGGRVQSSRGSLWLACCQKARTILRLGISTNGLHREANYRKLELQLVQQQPSLTLAWGGGVGNFVTWIMFMFCLDPFRPLSDVEGQCNCLCSIEDHQEDPAVKCKAAHCSTALTAPAQLKDASRYSNVPSEPGTFPNYKHHYWNFLIW